MFSSQAPRSTTSFTLALYRNFSEKAPIMETEAPDQADAPDTGGSTEGLSLGEILTIVGIVLTLITLACGGGLYWRLSKKKRKAIRSCCLKPCTLCKGNVSDQDTTPTENVVELSAGQPLDAEGDSLLRGTTHQQGAPTHKRDDLTNQQSIPTHQRGDTTNQQRETTNQQSIPTHQAEMSNQQQESPPDTTDRGVASTSSGASAVTGRGDHVSACLVNYKSVTMAPTQSTVLSNDSLIYQVAATDIDAPTYYSPLGLALLGNQADVANILGKPIPQFEEAMYQCHISFRNAKGRGWEESLMTIFEEIKLSDALALLKEGRPEDVSEDQFLRQLVDKIDCLSYYNELGTRLLNSSVKAQYKLGPVTPSYTKALYKCMIKWRDCNGATTDAYTKFRGILMSQGLVSQAENMDELERAGLDEVDLSSLPTPPNDTTRPEPKASLVTDT